MASTDTSSKSELSVELDDTEVKKQKHAYSSVYQQLARMIEPFGPVDRQKGVNVYEGVDIVNHKSKSHALNPIGVLLLAVEKLRRGEEELDKSTHCDNADQMPGPSGCNLDDQGSRNGGQVSAGTLNNTTVSIPDSPGVRVLVSRSYLERIERENELFRCHLRNFEIGVVKRLENVIGEALVDLRPRPTDTPSASPKSGTDCKGKGRSTELGKNVIVMAPKAKASLVHGIRKRGGKMRKMTGGLGRA